jgi:hypothetical protein
MSDGAVSSAAERDSNRIIEAQLDERAGRLADAADADVLAYIGPMYSPGDAEVKDAVEEIKAKRRRLIVLLETSGGHINVVERIAKIFRHHYRRVDFAVPTFAMSAGTVLVMSGDAILMDYASVLGPIDPQVMRRGQLVPALGYLAQYNRFVEKSNNGDLSTAELAYFLQNFDSAELYAYEQERELSTALLEEWLVNYKFKNWRVTKSGGRRVTRAMRVERARRIAEMLSEVSRWHSHSRGICMEVLVRDLNLMIDDFGAEPDLATPLHDYFHLLQDYRARRLHENFVIHTEGRHVGY